MTARTGVARTLIFDRFLPDDKPSYLHVSELKDYCCICNLNIGDVVSHRVTLLHQEKTKRALIIKNNVLMQE